MKFIFILTTSLLISSCVSSETALQYSKKESSDCTHHTVMDHHYGTSTNKQPALSTTNIAMACNGVETIKAYKCKFGWGIISDTTCHRNN